MASVVVSEIGIAPWYFGLGLSPFSSGATIETIVGSTPELVDQLFKYQTFLKKCEDAMVAQGLEVFKPIETVVNTYTERYTPTDRDTFKSISMSEFTATTSGNATGFTTLWQRYYEYSPAVGGKLYVCIDFGIMGRPHASNAVTNRWQMTGYSVTIGKAIGSNGIEQIMGSRYFPHIANHSSSNYAHNTHSLSTHFYFTASENSVFFSFGGYRCARFGNMDGRLSSALFPSTMHSGPIFTPFSVYAAEVPTTIVPGVYFPPRLSVTNSSSPASPLTVGSPSTIVSGGYAQFLLPLGVFETAYCGALCSELRSTSAAGRVFGTPFSMVINNGMIVASELIQMIDPDISSFDVDFLPFYIGENKKTVVKLPCIAQGVSYVGNDPNTAATLSSYGGETVRASGQTVFGVLLDETPVYY